MRISSVTLFACVLVLGVCALARSQEPQQPPVNRDANTIRIGENQGNATPPITVVVQTPEPRPEDKTKEDEYRQREVDAQETVASMTIAITILAVLQALITGFALLAAFNAAKAAKTSANIARDTLHLTQRADIVIDRISSDPHFGGELTPDTRITVWFQNRGRTRADDVVFEGTLGVPGGKLGEKRMAPPVVIAAGDQAPFSFEGTLGNNNLAGAIDGINRGKLTLRITGCMRYRDVFKKPHAITFEGEWDSPQAVFRVRKYDAD